MRVVNNLDPLLLLSNVKGELYRSPIVIQVRNFTTEAAETFCKQVEYAHHTGQPVIPIVIDSYGGEVHALLRMLTALEYSKLPIVTISSGKSMSCGSVLLAAGTRGYRYADPNTTVMIHDVSSGKAGKSEDLKVSSQETDRLKQLIFTKMAKFCDHDNRNYFIDLLNAKNNTDIYLTPLQAKKHKLIDHIGVPELQVSVNINMDFIP